MNSADRPPIDPELTLSDGTLMLRPWRDDDAPALFEAVHESIERLGRWLPWCTPTYDLAAARERVAVCRQAWLDGELYAFAVLELGGRLLGSVGLNQLNYAHRFANLGYWVRASAHGRGVAARATRLAAAFGFRELALIRVEIVTDPDNLASRRTAEKAGARFESIARHRLWNRDHPRDGAVYALLPGDLDAVRTGCQSLS